MIKKYLEKVHLQDNMNAYSEMTSPQRQCNSTSFVLLSGVIARLVKTGEKKLLFVGSRDGSTANANAAESHFGQNDTLARDTLVRMTFWPRTLWPETLWPEIQFGQCHFGW